VRKGEGRKLRGSKEGKNEGRLTADTRLERESLVWLLAHLSSRCSTIHVNEPVLKLKIEKEHTGTPGNYQYATLRQIINN
jgi:hypothetical protein